MENNVSAILEGLNSEQKAAVTCVDGPVLIVAGAGSGKTRVLTSRIAYILENGCGPDRILALTFTKKAASEMKERIALMVGQRKARRICMGTFHSVFIRFLREYAAFLGYPESFTIYDTSDSTSAIKNCIKELQLDDKVYKPKDVLSRISMAKNNLVTAEAYRQNRTIQENDFRAKKPRIADIYLKYSQICKQNGVMDFDDILLNMNILLRDSPEAQEAISGRFDYIMVDEYQDTNLSQYLILRRLALPHSNICVVGDDSQSIYAFRGAKIENILNFQKDYPTNHTFRLEQNYRSTRVIVDAANSLIAKNSARIPKRCFSEGDQGEKIKLIQAYTEQEEAILIANGIVSRIHSEHAEYQDFAILYRTNAQSRSLEEALRKRNLPYVIYSGNSFFERAEVKDIMAYLKLAVNLHDDESFRRVVNKPARGIGDTSMLALVAAAQTNGCSLFKAAFRDDLESYGLKNAAVQKIRNFCQMMNDAAVQVAGRDAHSLAVSISIDSGLYLHYKSDTSIEGQSRTANVEELLNSVKAYIEERHNEYYEDLLSEGEVTEGQELADSDFPVVTLSDYLENVSLLSAVDIEDDENGNNKVTLMTVHSSKGLEYPYVYVAGMEENLFPSGGFSALPNDIEEERRLFYVAMTRAKKALQLSFAQTRMRNGKHESNSPSRFVMEIDPQYIANPLSRSSSIYDDDEPSSSWNRRGEASSSSWNRRGEASSPSWSRRGGTSAVRNSEGRSAVTGGERRTGVLNRPVAGGGAVNRSSLGSAASASAVSFTPTPIVELALGDRIEHNRFGLGEIVEISGPVTDRKAKIVFDMHGEKILLLKYAKIRKVDVAH